MLPQSKKQKFLILCLIKSRKIPPLLIKKDTRNSLKLREKKWQKINKSAIFIKIND